MNSFLSRNVFCIFASKNKIMTGIALLIWFWLMAGVLFCSTTITMHLFENTKWWLKTLFWPYYLVVYAIHYIKVYVPDLYYFVAYQAWKIKH